MWRDCVKFQFFNAEKLIIPSAPKAPYQRTNKTKSQLDIIKKCEITFEELKKLKRFCKIKKIDFLCTPFEIHSLKKLIKIGIKSLKISSCNLTNLPFLKEVAKSKLPVILSTGMGNLKEVNDAIKVLNRRKLMIFQCTSNYPAKSDESNLLAINTFKKLNVPVGFSDHTQDITSALVAFGLGVRVFEKHFTLSNNLSGIDQKASLNIKDFKKYVMTLNQAFLSLGNGKKVPSKSEKKVLVSLRKSIVANQDINPGQKLKINMFDYKRPGNGINTKEVHKIVGMIAKKEKLQKIL